MKKVKGKLMSHTLTIDIDYHHTLLTKNTLGNLFFKEKELIDKIVTDSLSYLQSESLIQAITDRCVANMDLNEIQTIFESTAKYNFDQKIRATMYDALILNIKQMLNESSTKDHIEKLVLDKCNEFMDKYSNKLLTIAMSNQTIIDKLNKLRKLKALNKFSN